jgi:ADP-ribosyl-[dinitrogen reductase] hydrolase
MMTAQHDRAIGALVGLAVGDAVGTTLEFRAPGTFEPITDMIGGGPFRLAPGEWTDDTSMALCLAESIVERQGFDPADQLERYCRWWREGHLSSTGRCFDIGNQVRAALSEHERTGLTSCGPDGPMNAGNGSLMRLAPVPVAWMHDPTKAIQLAGESSQTTHRNRECVDACRYFAGLIVGAIRGASKDDLLSPFYSPAPDVSWTGQLVPKVEAIAAGSFKTKAPPELRGTGYVIDCLEASFWAFASTDTFDAAVLAAANLGDDADTTAAVTGQLAGAHYGVDAIPPDWRRRLAHRELIDSLAARLIQLASERGSEGP